MEHGDEEIELAEEAGERRDAGERQQKNEQAGGEDGSAAAESVKVGEAIAAGLLLDDGDDAEGSEGGERVGDDVVEKRGEALLRVGDDGEQHVAGVGDGGVGEQAAQAASARWRPDCRAPWRARPRGRAQGPSRVVKCSQRGAAFRAGKADGQDLEEDEEAGDLGAGGDEGGAGCGRALVDIRRPEVEGRGGDFEAEADRGGDDGDQQERIQRDRRPWMAAAMRGRLVELERP